MSLLNLCLSLKTDTTPSKLEKANLTAWSQINPGRKMVAKIRCLPFLRGPTRFRKLRHISESRKRHWISVPSSFSFAVFDPMAKTNFGGGILCIVRLCLSLPQIIECAGYPILPGRGQYNAGRI